MYKVGVWKPERVKGMGALVVVIAVNFVLWGIEVPR